MQGIFVRTAPGAAWVRPTSKKAVREALAADPANVRIEATSFHGNEFDGNASDPAAPAKVAFVGPDPARKRNFYGTATRNRDGIWKVV
jgi:hypothetical protein